MLKRGLSLGKPQSQQIDWGHPLSQGLRFACILNEGAGRTIDLATRTRSASAVRWTTTPKGIGFDGDGATEINFGHRADWNPPAGASATMAVLANPASEGTSRGMLTKRQNGGGFEQIALTANVDASGVASAGSVGSFFRSGGGASYKHASVSGVINGSYRLFSCVFMPETGVDNKMYVDGVQYAITASKNFSPTYIGTDPLCIGSANATQYFNDNILLAYYWPFRGLTDSEMRWLAEEPYAFIKQLVPRAYFIAGTAIAVTGTSAVSAPAATLSASGDIVNAYTGSSALSAAPATLAATGTISGAAPTSSNFMLLGVG